MARPLRIEYVGAFYHVTSRGNEQRDIFRDPKDREKFISYLESATQRYGAVIHTFCLMDNHYHLFLETPLGNLSQIMRHINGAYTTYFNVRHQRSGHLLQGRFKAILVEANEYAKELSRYIHLNPARANVVDKVITYPWSSYPYYVGRRRIPGWLKTDFILGYFGKRLKSAMNNYREFVEAVEEEECGSPLKDVIASTILGSSDFVENIKEKYLSVKEANRDVPALRELLEKPTIEMINIEVKSILTANAKLSRQVSLYLCHKYSGKKLKEIGGYFGVSESAVTQASHRLVMKITRDRKLKKAVEILEEKLKNVKSVDLTPSF